MPVDKMKGKNTLGTEATVKIGQILLCSILIVFMFFFHDIRCLNINFSLILNWEWIVILHDHLNV